MVSHPARLLGDHPSMPCHVSSITIAHWKKHGTTLRSKARHAGVRHSIALQGEARRQAPYQLSDRTSEEGHGRTSRWSNGSIVHTGTLIASADVHTATHEECNVCHHGHEQENWHSDEAHVDHRPLRSCSGTIANRSNMAT